MVYRLIYINFFLLFHLEISIKTGNDRRFMVMISGLSGLLSFRPTRNSKNTPLMTLAGSAAVHLKRETAISSFLFPPLSLFA